MFTVMDRYVGRKLVVAWLLVWVIMSSIFGLLAFVDEIERVTARYTVLDALQFILYTLPQRSMDLAPVIVLMGSILALAGLNKHSEIIAVRAAGVSLLRLFGAVAVPAGLLVVLLYTVSEYVAAPLYQQAEIQKTLTRSGQPNLLTGKGLWSNNERRFFNVRALKGSEIPRSIYLYEFAPDGRLLNFIYADHAQLTRNRRRWDLIQVSQKTLHNGTLETSRKKHLEMGPFWSRNELPALPLSAAGMTPSDLYEYAGYLKTTNQLSTRIEQLFWQRIALPLTTGAMVFLAIPIGASVGSVRSNAFGRNLAMGAAVGIIFYLFSQLVQTGAAIIHIPPSVAAFAPVILVLSVAVGLVSRMR
jgi:lipopolysaccharide export system permease protein